MMVGDCPRLTSSVRPVNELERPNILFVYRQDEAGNIVVEDDVRESECPAWNGYFGMDRLDANLREALARQPSGDYQCKMHQIGL